MSAIKKKRFNIHHLPIYSATGTTSKVLGDDVTIVLAGSWDDVRMEDIGLSVNLPPGTVSTTNVAEARRKTLREVVSRLDDIQLEKLFEDLARCNRREGFDDAILFLHGAHYESLHEPEKETT